MATTHSRRDRSSPIQGSYSDGHPLDEIHYLECKIILKPDPFTSVQSFHEFGSLAQRTADQLSVGYCDDGVADQRPRIREVLFFDTPQFTLYNNAFILRRRIPYQDGFPAGEPEIVFKFRHPDMRTAAALDVRPNIPGKYRVKFKSEALPLRNQVGGFRRLFSHNAGFGLSQVSAADCTSMTSLARVFRPLAQLIAADSGLDLVNQTIVEEVLQDLGRLDFGEGVTAASNVALWRQRGDHTPLVGEFSFECKFNRGNAFHKRAMKLSEQFFVALQRNAGDLVSLGTTKTGIVYKLKGNSPLRDEE
jgi:hypothetical protein